LSVDAVVDLALLIGAAASLFAAWRLQRSSGPTRALHAILFVVLAGLLLRTHASRDQYLHPWDERYHALVAKNLIRDPLRPVLYRDPVLPYDYREPFANHVWLHKPPLTLWLMAASLATFGVSEFAARLPGVLASTLSILAVAGAGRRLVGERPALLGAALYATNGFLLDLAGGRVATDHIDTLFVSLVALGAFLSVDEAEGEREDWRKLIGLGAITGLALLTKWLVALLVPAIWLAAVLPRRRPRSVILGLGILLAVAASFWLPWVLYTRVAFPREAAWESSMLLRHIFTPVDWHGGPWYWYLGRMPRIYGGIVFIPMAWFLVTAVRDRSRRLLPLLVWAAIPYLVFSAMATKMLDYVAPAAPAVGLVTAAFWVRLQGRFASETSALRRWGLGLVLILVLALPARYTVERLIFEVKRERGWARQLQTLAPRVDEKTVLFGTGLHAIEAMFVTPAIAYPRLPTQDEWRELTRKGYRVRIVRKDGTLADFDAPSR